MVQLVYNIRGDPKTIKARITELIQFTNYVIEVGALAHLSVCLLTCSQDEGVGKHGLAYAHPVFEAVIQRAFFYKPDSEGVLYFNLFNPIPIVLFALVAAAVCNLVDHMSSPF